MQPASDAATDGRTTGCAQLAIGGAGVQRPAERGVDGGVDCGGGGRVRRARRGVCRLAVPAGRMLACVGRFDVLVLEWNRK